LTRTWIVIEAKGAEVEGDSSAGDLCPPDADNTIAIILHEINANLTLD